jgi:hypothetical protein
MVFELPWRLRVGRLFRWTLPDDRNPSDQVWVYNKADAPDHPNIAFMQNRPDLTSRVLLLARVSPSAAGLQQIRQDQAYFEDAAAPRCHDLLRRIVLAYLRTTNCVISGGLLRPISLQELYVRSPILCSVVVADGVPFAERHALELLTHEPSHRVIGPDYGGVGEFTDLPEPQLEALRQHLEDASLNAIYELRLKAIAAIIGGDAPTALVLACAAMEGAHGAFLRAVLATKLSGEDGMDLTQNLLREQGIHTVFRLTLQLWVPEDLRPNPDVVKKCKKGLELRNDIAHVKFSSGKFKVEHHGLGELNDAYSAVLEVQEAFAKSLMRLLKHSQG